MQLPDHIALRRMTYDAAQTDAWLQLLSGEERSRYDAFPVDKRRREFLLGRVALRTLLAERLDKAPTAIDLQVTDDGAIELPGAPYFVSLAHSRGRAVAAVSPDRVGVDLEHIRSVTSGVVDFVLDADEQALLDTLPMDREHAFILCWTLKEATLKALQTGLLQSPKNVQLAIDPEAQQASAIAWDDSVWTVCYEPAPDHFLSVAYPAS
jgi:4'-phosphopantetheinyl transferase